MNREIKQVLHDIVDIGLPIKHLAVRGGYIDIQLRIADRVYAIRYLHGPPYYDTEGGPWLHMLDFSKGLDSEKQPYRAKNTLRQLVGAILMDEFRQAQNKIALIEREMGVVGGES